MRPFVFRITLMASNAAHHATGWAAGLIAATFVAQASHTSLEHLASILAFCAAVAGSTAPDWMEVAWWTRARRLWITHRTATHWGIGWVAALVLSYQALSHDHLWAPLLFGFACGGRRGALAAVGAALFLISDAVLLFVYFYVRPRKALRAVNLAAYYLGMLCLALSV